jgi:DNA-binding protein YbaB
MEDLLRDLAELRQYADGLQQLMAEFQQASPERSEGTGGSGMVRAVYGPDGMPETITVSPYWAQKLAPDDFAAAVTGACQAAAAQRGAAWSQRLQASGWQDRADRLDQETPGSAVASPGPAPRAQRRPTQAIPPRDVNRFAEDAIGLLDSVIAAAGPAPPAPVGNGTSGNGALTIELTAGGHVSCRADPLWVSRHTGTQLTEALRDTLAAARQSLAAADAGLAPGAADAAARAAQLLADNLPVPGEAAHQADPMEGT